MSSARQHHRRARVALAAVVVVIGGAMPWAQPARAIVNGVSGTAPGLVRLDVGGEPFCSGIQIDGPWVLTAAHCVVDPRIETLVDVSVSTATGGIDVVEAVVHPGFDATPGTAQHDLALLRIATPVTSAARLASSSPAVGSSAILAGWGLQQAGGAPPTTAATGPALVTTATDLTFSTAGPTLACDGDSGGPVFDSVTFEVVGVISAADPGCAEFGIHVQVAAELGWIDSVVQRDGRAPVVRSGALATLVDTPVEVPLEVTDEQPVSIDTQVTFVTVGGSITGCAADTPPTTCTFTPAAGFQGEASVQIRVFDGTNTGTGEWSIVIGDGPPPNQRPVLTRLPRLTTVMDQPVDFVLDFFDPDGTSMTFANVTLLFTGFGTIDGCGETPPLTCTFHPRLGFVGRASIIVNVSDGIDLDAMTISVDVLPPGGSPPVVESRAIDVVAGDEFTVEFVAEDDLLGPLGASAITFVDDSDFTPTSCDAESIPASCTYTTEPGVARSGTITVTFSDGFNEASGTIIVRVLAGGEPPTVTQPAESSIVVASEASTLVMPVAFTDPEGEPLDSGDVVEAFVEGGIGLGCSDETQGVVCRFSFELGTAGTHVGRLTVGDNAGNTTTVQFSVEVRAYTGPIASMPPMTCVDEPSSGRLRVDIPITVTNPGRSAITVAVTPTIPAIDGVDPVESADVVARAAKVRVRAGQTTATYQLTVLSDRLPEGTEYLALELASSDALLATSVAYVCIGDAG